MSSLLAAFTASARAAGVMKTCRNTNISGLPAPPSLPPEALSRQFHEVHRLRQQSSTVIWTHCGGNYSICQSTVPRWRQYARVLRYDLLVLRDRDPAITGIATYAWDRVFVAWQLMERGYEWVMHVDGDTGVLDSRLSIHDFVGRLGCGQTPFLYVSQDVGKHGFLPAPCGPNNFGVFIVRNCAGARAMLQHVIAQSQRPGRFWQAWPAEQGVVNTWLETQAAGSYCQARYGRMQKHISKYDHPIHLQKSTAPMMAGSKASKAAGWAGLIEKTLDAYQQAGVWILHTPAMQTHQAFANAIYSHVERLYPISESRTDAPRSAKVRLDPGLPRSRAPLGHRDLSFDCRGCTCDARDVLSPVA